MPDSRQLPTEQDVPDFDSFSRFYDEYFDRSWLLLVYVMRPVRPTEEAMEAVMRALAMEWASGAEYDRLHRLLRQRLKDVRALAREDHGGGSDG